MNCFRDLNIGDFFYCSSVAHTLLLKIAKDKFIFTDSRDVYPTKYHLSGDASPFTRILI